MYEANPLKSLYIVSQSMMKHVIQLERVVTTKIAIADKEETQNCEQNSILSFYKVPRQKSKMISCVTRVHYMCCEHTCVFVVLITP